MEVVGGGGSGDFIAAACSRGDGYYRSHRDNQNGEDLTGSFS